MVKPWLKLLKMCVEDIFIIQPTCAPTNDNLMELLVMADALRRSSASRITAVFPISAMLAKIGEFALLEFPSQQKSLQI